MPRKWILALVLACTALAGCSLTSKQPAPAVVHDGPVDAQLVHDYLMLLDELTTATPSRQAEITESARKAATSEPTTASRLRYAFILATPGHPATNDTEARAAFNAVLTGGDRMMPGERALASLMLREVDARIAAVRAQRLSGVDEVAARLHQIWKEPLFP